MKSLHIDNLLSYTKDQFSNFYDERKGNKSYSLGDIVQSGLAIFSLKEPSLLEFNNTMTGGNKNLLRIYKIKNCPGNSQFRQVLDGVNPRQIEKVHQRVIRKVKKSGLLKDFEFIKGWKILLVDGVHHFSSQTIKCDRCQTTRHKDGSITYSHSMLSSVIVNPKTKIVLPLCQEPITNQDGSNKNDCELNAANRLIDKIQTRHLDEKFIFVEDALFANGPHIRRIEEKENRFIIRVKKGSGAGYVIEQFLALKNKEDHPEFQQKPIFRQNKKIDSTINKPTRKPAIKQIIEKGEKINKCWSYVNGLVLNKSNPDIKVNFFGYEEVDKKTGKVKKSFQWITNIIVSAKNVKGLTQIGRSRWMIENETFNSLKNQGYHFEHNYGHGQEHLCTNMALLMMLAFLIDQIQQFCNQHFQKALAQTKTKKRLWRRINAYFETSQISSMHEIYLFIINKTSFNLSSPGNSP